MISFILGFLASLLATAVWVGLSMLRSYRQLRHLVGYWFQDIPGYEGQSSSIGRFTYNPHSRSFAWDGTNYADEGKPLCDWETVLLHADLSFGKILYTFRGNSREEPFRQFYGFGVMTLERAPGRAETSISGFFQDAQESVSPQSFTLTRLEDIAADLGVTQGTRTRNEFHSDIVQHFQQRKHRKRPNQVPEDTARRLADPQH